MPEVSCSSEALLAANMRLLALRERHQQSNTRGRADLSDSPTVKSKAASADWVAAANDLPVHLGWGSAALTAVLRRKHQEKAHNPNEWISQCTSVNCQSEEVTDDKRNGKLGAEAKGWVKLYPAIGLGMLRRELTAAGRLWLMLRFLDLSGQGHFRIDVVINLLTNRSSNLRLCGKRQLRNLLHDGEGVYWHRDKTNVWLFSAARVAAKLQVEQLTGQPVAMPVSVLLAGIGTFRAHLYAAFHSSRTKEAKDGRRAMPIARKTVTRLSGVGASSQRVYEARVGITVRANFVLGPSSTKENLEKSAWAHGQALFNLKDYRGQQGQMGKTYLAWQLPNSYLGQHQHRPRGRQKRINRKLKDLVMKGMPGNVEGTVKTQAPEKIYYPNGKLAAQAYGRNTERDLYWRQFRTGNGRFAIWHHLGV